ncbi:MAG: 4Fe-4S dicluster domain-containing protein [Mariprofundus sp.]
MKTFSDCHGCSLCLLPCPMWRQYRDVSFSPQGIAKAMQYGAVAKDMTEQLSSCIKCGACDVICPEHIDLTGLISTCCQQAGLPQDELQSEPELSGFVISCDPAVQAQIREDDLYIIDAAPFHAHYADRVGHYDALRKQTGCSMNLDLNRLVIPTGIASLAASTQQFDVKEQIEWLLQGRSFKRMIIENTADQNALLGVSGKQVIHISELIKETINHA